MASMMCFAIVGKFMSVLRLTRQNLRLQPLQGGWEEEGRMAYPEAKEILILADSGGSNGCRPRMWKQQLQEHFSDHYGLTITIAHYPTGCSKWNPIEHRLFSQISKHWAAEPLLNYEKMLGFIRNTRTTTGLVVTAYLDRAEYPIG